MRTAIQLKQNKMQKGSKMEGKNKEKLVTFLDLHHSLAATDKFEGILVPKMTCHDRLDKWLI